MPNREGEATVGRRTSPYPGRPRALSADKSCVGAADPATRGSPYSAPETTSPRSPDGPTPYGRSRATAGHSAEHSTKPFRAPIQRNPGVMP